MLVKTAGVKHLVILINKMDDPTVKWEQKRYDYCKDQLTPYLKSVGFNPAKGGCIFMPCSGLTGQVSPLFYMVFEEINPQYPFCFFIL